MSINVSIQDVGNNLHPKITVLGVGGSGGNAVNNMINANLEGVDFLIANTDAQALQISQCSNKIQLGLKSTKGLGAGMRPDIGRQAAEEAIDEISEKLEDSHMLFIAAGMGGGTGTGAAPIIAKLAREKGILTVGVVTKPFHFEGSQRMKLAENGIEDLQQFVDTLLTIPNQNLFRIANEKTTFSDAFKMADDVLYAGVRGVTDLMVQPGMINLDFSDIKTVMSEMGKAMMGTGEASGERRAVSAAEAAIANPLIDDVSLKGAKGLIINITGGKDITLYEVDEAANRIKQEVDEQANIIYGTTCDDRLEGIVRVSIVATGIGINNAFNAKPIDSFTPISINNEVYKDKVDQEIKPLDTINQETNLEEKINSSDIGEKNIFVNETLSDDLVNQDSDDLDSNETNFESENINNINDIKITDDSNTLQDNEISANNGIGSNSHNLDELERESIVTETLETLDTKEIIETNETNETKVRRLSLFDTVENEKSEDSISLEKNEPIISDNMDNDQVLDSENENTEKNDDPEFNPIESEENALDEEFNQESEEELLDIPTFLRRQAN